MKRRNLILLLGGASSGAMSVGTGAFSSMEAERGVEVNVVEDRFAYVGYRTPSDGETVLGGDSITLVVVTNRFADDQRLGIVGAHISQGDDLVENIRVEEETENGELAPVNPDLTTEADFESRGVSEAESFGTGERVHVRADIAGSEVDVGKPVDIEVTIGVTGLDGEVAARLFGDTRTFTVTGGGVKFPGESGNPKLKPDDVGGVRARAYFRDENGNLDKTEFQRVRFGDPLRTNQEFNTDERYTIKGIEIEGSGKVYRRSDASGGEKVVTEPVNEEAAFD